MMTNKRPPVGQAGGPCRRTALPLDGEAARLTDERADAARSDNRRGVSRPFLAELLVCSLRGDAPDLAERSTPEDIVQGDHARPGDREDRRTAFSNTSRGLPQAGESSVFTHSSRRGSSTPLLAARAHRRDGVLDARDSGCKFAARLPRASAPILAGRRQPHGNSAGLRGGRGGQTQRGGLPRGARAEGTDHPDSDERRNN